MHLHSHRCLSQWLHKDLLELEQLAVLILTLCCSPVLVLSKALVLLAMVVVGQGGMKHGLKPEHWGLEMDWIVAFSSLHSFHIGCMQDFINKIAGSGSRLGVSIDSTQYHTLCSCPQCSGGWVGSCQPPASPTTQDQPTAAAGCCMAMSSLLHQLRRPLYHCWCQLCNSL